MDKNREFDNILDECLERLLVKGETIDQCLQSYPEHADELRPLLQMAVEAKTAIAIQPRPEFRERARYQMQAAFHQATEPRRGLRLIFRLSRGWAIALSIALVVLLAGGGTVAAAGYSMPDSPLYPVKLATEQVQMAFTFTDMGKAELHARLTDRRVAEIAYLASKGTPQQVEQIVQRLDNHLGMIASLTSTQAVMMTEETAEEATSDAAWAPTFEESQLSPGDPRLATGPPMAGNHHKAELRTILGHNAVDQPARLRAALETAPPSIRPILLQAIALSEAGYETVLEALDY
jgi:hypothetical protein